jgi:hypothetical protein
LDIPALTHSYLLAHTYTDMHIQALGIALIIAQGIALIIAQG